MADLELLREISEIIEVVDAILCHITDHQRIPEVSELSNERTKQMQRYVKIFETHGSTIQFAC